MDIGCLLGRTSFSFTGNDGRLIEGYKFHCAFNAPLTDPNFEGQAVAAHTVMKNRFDLWQQHGFFVPKVGEPCVLRYDSKGRLECFDRVPDLVE